MQNDAKIRQLRELGLFWPAIAEQFLGRTAGIIVARYYTKIKTADPFQTGFGSCVIFFRAPSAEVGDTDEGPEWEVEEICGHRRLDDDSVELLVRWKGGEEIWELYKNVAETEALDRFERLRGPVTVVTL